MRSALVASLAAVVGLQVAAAAAPVTSDTTAGSFDPSSNASLPSSETVRRPMIPSIPLPPPGSMDDPTIQGAVVYGGFDIDIAGNDAYQFTWGTMYDCIHKINDQHTAATTRDGTCYMKYKNDGVYPTSGAQSFVKLPKPIPEGYMYYYSENCDFPGNDYKKIWVTWDECHKACYDAGAHCMAATWRDYNGGVCWLKGRGGECVYKKGFWSLVTLKPYKYF